MTSWERLLRWEQAHRFALDAALAALLLVVLLPSTVAVSAASGNVSARLAVVVTVALVTPLAWRRTAPTASAAAVYLVAALQLVAGAPIVVPADAVVLVALYSVTVNGPRWAHRTAIAGALLGALLLAVSLGGGWTDSSGARAVSLFAGVSALAVWAFGLVRRTRRERLEALEDRARRLEVERDQQTQIATAAERARIARELHDIVAHSLTVMIAQADGGRYAADADPSAATRALGTIGETGRAALTDMRRLLGVLRGGDHQDLAYEPPPAESDVGALVEQLRTGGLRVSLVRMGTPRTLPPGAGLTVYRIAQEALTNVLKHAGPDPLVSVLVQWLPDAIVLEVSDDGRGASAESDGLGQGLLGMRERATIFAGTVSAGPRPGGGFRVRAQLPTPHGLAQEST